jgi:hypothetical protein
VVADAIRFWANRFSARRAIPTDPPSTSCAVLFHALVLTAALYGCGVGPDFHSIAARAVPGYTPDPLPSHTASADVIGGTSQTLFSGEGIPGEWWTLFHSSQLNRMIEQA